MNQSHHKRLQDLIAIRNAFKGNTLHIKASPTYGLFELSLRRDAGRQVVHHVSHSSTNLIWNHIEKRLNQWISKLPAEMMAELNAEIETTREKALAEVQGLGHD